MSQRPLAVFTIACNEPFFYPMWSAHYAHHAPTADLFVLSDRNYRSDEFAGQLTFDAESRGRISDVKVQAPKAFDHSWLRETVQAFQRFLLQTYRYVLFAEIDEFWAHPAIMLDDAVAELNPGEEIFRARGYDVSRPPDLDPLPEMYNETRPFLRNHDRWAPSRLYSKPTLATVPCNWTKGFHDLVAQQAVPTELVLIHCHKYDFAAALARSREIKERDWSQSEVDARLGWQNRISDEDQMRTYFERDIDNPQRIAPFAPIPEWARRRI